MKTILTILVFHVIAAFLVTSMTVAPTSSAPSYDLNNCGLLKSTSTGSEATWDKFPITYYIDQSVPPAFRMAVYESAQMWNKQLGFQAIYISPYMTQIQDIPTDKNIIVWSTRPESMPAQFVGLTMPTYNGNTIQTASIIINAAQYNFSVYDVQLNRIDLTSLMIHEFGHALGLQHSDESHSIMLPSLSNAQIRQEISKEDKRGVLCAVSKSDMIRALKTGVATAQNNH